jgi:hypothetical protein
MGQQFEGDVRFNARGRECPGWNETDAACSPACLRSALDAQGHRRRWSEPMAVADWLNALRAWIDRDPEQTPIGEFAGTA